MTKIIFLLNINNYSPEITSITYPAIEKYAERIGARIIEIQDRKYPDFPIVYEKLQIFDLAKQNPADWYIYIDSDALIKFDLPDITKWLEKDTVFQVNSDPADVRFRLPIKDERNIGTCNWFTIFSDQCIDLFNPDIGMAYDEMLLCMTPTEEEAKVFDSLHLIDDYVLSFNLAKHGFKYKNAKDLQDTYHCNYFHHEYLVTEKEKLQSIKRVDDLWKNEEARIKNFMKGKPDMLK